MQTQIESPIDTFRKLVEISPSAIVREELRYRFGTEEEAIQFEIEAGKIILVNNLQLVANSEKWSSRRIVREIAVVISPVPEDYYQDEAQDMEGLTGGWWNTVE